MPTGMPCGYVFTGKLADNLKHYAKCSNPICQHRHQLWVEEKLASAKRSPKPSKAKPTPKRKKK